MRNNKKAEPGSITRSALKEKLGKNNNDKKKTTDNMTRGRRDKQRKTELADRLSIEKRQVWQCLRSGRPPLFLVAIDN